VSERLARVKQAGGDGCGGATEDEDDDDDEDGESLAYSDCR
jgi:hypothetical protein